MSRLGRAGAALLGVPPGTERRLPGGDLSQIVHVTLADGREAIVKSGPAPLAEAAMLQAISASGAPAPAVLAVDDEVLVLEYLPAGGRLGAAWADLGRVLAHLHAVRGEGYGWAQGYAFGALPIDNQWSDDWPAFWAERRLLPHLQGLPASLARRVERVALDLPQRLPARPAPALLHGDLWGGNVLVHGDRVSGLIDPACYYGHGEVDIAMLQLFDHPQAAFFAAYGSLGAGAAERLAIYRLWPALVHMRLFGSVYRPLVERTLDEAGG